MRQEHPRLKIEKNLCHRKAASDFLRALKRSEYNVVEQLSKTPAQISILGLLLVSEVHRAKLLKVLNEAHIPSNVTPEEFQDLISQIWAPHIITFTDDEIPPDGTGHTKALYITVRCKEMIVARVLIDNGSALNVCPLATLNKQPVDQSYIQSNSIFRRGQGGLLNCWLRPLFPVFPFTRLLAYYLYSLPLLKGYCLLSFQFE